MVKNLIGVMIIVVLLLTPAVIGQTDAGNWSVRTDDVLYYIGATMNVTVHGPPGSYFILYLELNGTVLGQQSGVTGPKGNNTVSVVLYKGDYKPGDYALNLTYMDENVASWSVSVVWNQAVWNGIQLEKIKDDDLPRLYSNDERHSEDITANRELTMKTAIMAIVGFLAGMWAMFLAVLFILLPKWRYDVFVAKNKATALRELGKKSGLDIYATNGIQPPHLQPPTYNQVMDALKTLGHDDDDLYYALWQETGRWFKPPKPEPVAAVGNYVIFKGSIAEWFRGKVKKKEEIPEEPDDGDIPEPPEEPDDEGADAE